MTTNTTPAAPALSDDAQGVAELYAALAEYECAPVRLADLRELLVGDDARDAFEGAVRELAEVVGVHLRAVVDQATLRGVDHDAAVVLGGQARHTIAIEWAELES